MARLQTLLEMGEQLSKRTFELLSNSVIQHVPVLSGGANVVCLSTSRDYYWAIEEYSLTQLNTDLNAWVNQLFNDDKINSDRTCFKAAHHLKSLVESGWRVHSDNRENELNLLRRDFNNILEVLKATLIYDEPESILAHTQDLNFTIYAQQVNISIQQVDSLVVELEKLDNAHILKMNDDLKKAINEYKEDTKNPSKIKNFFSKLKSGISSTNECFGFIQALLTIFSSMA